jgi:hypothetical protein
MNVCRFCIWVKYAFPCLLYFFNLITIISIHIEANDRIIPFDGQTFSAVYTQYLCIYKYLNTYIYTHTYISHFFYSFVCWWTPKLSPFLSCCN